MELPVFRSTEGLLALILMMVALAYWVQRFKVFKFVGPALFVILLGMVLVNLKIVPGYHDVYGSIMQYVIPLSISIYLLDVNLPTLAKLSGKALVAMVLAVGSVCVMAIVFGSVFGASIPEGWKTAGMFVGTYTGGSANLTAIAVGLDAANETIAAANAADYVIGMPTMVLLFAAPTLFQSVPFLKKIWPYHLTEAQRTGSDDGSPVDASKATSIQDITWILAIGMTVVAVSTLISSVFPASFRHAGRILLISTFSLVLAQIPAVARLKGKFNLGLFFGLMYLCIIGFSVNLASFFGSTLSITLFCFCVILGTLLLHLLLCRLCKIPYEYVILSITGAVADGTTSSLVASGAKWSGLAGLGLIMGLLGGVCGNYVGIAVAYIIKAILGA